MSFSRSKDTAKTTRRFKVLLFGPHGVGKTTVALQTPGPTVIDMEQGTIHYEELYDFIWERTSDSDKVLQIINNIAEQPNIKLPDDVIWNTKTVVLDPIHIWELSLEQKIIAKRRKEERNPDYVLQPQDYKLIKIEKKKLMLQLMTVDLNVVVCARTKDLYAPGEFMKKVGIGPDCDQQWLGYFDTILLVYIDKITKKHMAVIYDKDRTGKFPKDKAGNFLPFEWSYANFSTYLKDLNFDTESDVNKTHQIQDQMVGRHFKTMFRDKEVKTAGVNGETLEKIATYMSTEDGKVLIENALNSAEVTSPYDLTQDMADFLISGIEEKENKKTNEI